MVGNFRSNAPVQVKRVNTNSNFRVPEMSGFNFLREFRVWDLKTRITRPEIFGKPDAHYSIVHPHWWRLQPTKGNDCASPRRAPHKGSMNKQPCLSPHGHRPWITYLTRVDLHEVGDLPALTNFLVQLHILSEAPKWHLTNLGAPLSKS